MNVSSITTMMAVVGDMRSSIFPIWWSKKKNDGTKHPLPLCTLDQLCKNLTFEILYA